MPVRGIRGATAVEKDLEEEILQATHKMLQAIVQENPGLHPADIASVLFTVTEDLHSAFPARAARDLGWQNVPLMCFQEIPVPGSLPRAIRVLIHWNTDLGQEHIHHIYLGAARTLRPDLLEKKISEEK